MLVGTVVVPEYNMLINNTTDQSAYEKLILVVIENYLTVSTFSIYMTHHDD